MDLLSKDEPLIDLNSFDSNEDHEDLLSEEYQPHNQRRLESSKHVNNSSRQHRLPSGSKVHVRELSSKEQTMDRQNSVIVAAVERTMKNYADGVLRVLEGMSRRLSQLESISHDLEHSISNLKDAVDYSHDHSEENFKALNERVMEMHRGVQILRDKQDIIEAHAQLAKLQTSKALVEKERMPRVGSTDSLGLKHHEDSSSTMSQMPGSQSSLSQVQSVAAPSLISQSPPVALHSSGMPQYQSSNVQSQQLVPAQHMPQEGSGHALQQVSTVQTPPEQIHYKGKSQQLPSVQIMPSPQQPILQTHQSLEQGHYLPTLPHVQMQQPSNQQSVHLIPHQQTEQMQYQPAPQQMQVQLPSQPQSVQQPVQAQLGTMSQQQLQPQQGMITQQPVQVHQPPHLQQQPGSRFQSSLQYYGQSNDGQSYVTANPSSSAYTQGMYVSETVHDSSNYSANQRQVAASPTHQPSQLPPIHGFHQMSLAQNNQLPQDTPVVGNISAPSAWNRQANLAAPVGVARLPAAQAVRAEHPPEGSGIVDKVASMGFSRDQVQSVIRKLAERNQAIDMNVVLDILMNGSRGTQGGFAR